MTKALCSRWLGGALTALVALLPALAEAPRLPKPGRPSQPYVVLVGVNDYADKLIKPRKHAEADAKALYDVLTDKKYLGADPKNVRLLLGSADAKRGAEKATRAKVLESLKWVAGQAKVNDLVLIAFIGEGGPLGESGDRRCYFAADSTFKGRDKDAIAADEIDVALKDLKSQRVCVFLDVDFTGFNVAGGARAVAEPTLGKSPYKEFLGDDGTEEHAAKRGRIVYLATNGLSPSLDLADHGLFTKVLVDGLKGAADKEGYEADGLVTVDELSDYVDKQLPDLARKHGTTDKQKQQAHFILGGRAGHFVLTTNPDAVAKKEERLTKLGAQLKDKKLPAKYADEARGMLERMPRLKKRQELRKAYQQFVDGKLALEAFETKREGILDSMKMRWGDALTFGKKVMEATEMVKDTYIKEVNQGEMIAWAVQGLYQYAEEPVPEAVEAKLKNAKKLRAFDLTRLVAEARQGLGLREDLEGQKDLNVTLRRMLHKLDPYTTYIDPETKKKWDDEIKGNFTGIGIQIRKDAATDQLLVVTPIKGSPAYKAKLMAGDLITTIIREVDSDGNPIPKQVVSTKGLPLSKAVKLILGQADTKVKLTIQREGTPRPFDVEITRGLVEVESVLGIRRKADDGWDYLIDPVNKIGYIRLTSFARNSYRDLARVMQDLTDRQGIKGFVLDLRFNPGGLLDSAVKITDLFIDDGLIVTVRPRQGVDKEIQYRGRRAGSLLDFPMVCLVNGYSASGSEIVSAALQDHRRALILGERSYGKGSVQHVLAFEDGDIKLTVATFWRPSNKNLNKSSTAGRDEDEWGVVPDKVVKLTPKEREDLAEHQRNAEIIERPDKRGKNKTEFKDKQLDAALQYLRGQIKMASRKGARQVG
jgi:C-terminal peptidase prc